MLRKIKRYIQLKSFFLANKVIVIESDDWGFAHIYDKNKYANIKHCISDFSTAYAYFTLEDEFDLRLLQDVCFSFKDQYGEPCQITANFIVEQPDFKRIIEHDYKQLFFKPIDIDKYKRIIQDKVFYPQFHGRHHFNIKNWHYDLLEDMNDARFLVNNSIFVLKDKNLQRYNGENAEVTEEIVKFHDRDYLEYLIKGGSITFEKIFGFKSKSVIAPSYYKNYLCERIYKEIGVKYIQGDDLSHIKKVDGKLVNKNSELGQYENGFVSLRRNITFEPSRAFFYGATKNKIDIFILHLQSEINYLKGNPLVICSHSYNYIGGLNKEMAEFSVKQLGLFLNKLHSKRVLYLNSENLGDIYSGGRTFHNGKLINIPESISLKMLVMILLSYIYRIFITVPCLFAKVLRRMSVK